MTPLSWAGLGFSLGTLWGLSARPSRWLVLGLLLGSLFAALFWKERKKGGILIFFLLPAFFIGALSGRERQSAASRMAPFLGNPVRLTGRLEPGSLRVRDRSVSFTLLYEGMRIPVLHLGTLPGPSWGTYTAEGCLEPIETFYNPGMVDETKRSAARKIPGASFFCSATPSFAGFGHLSAEQCSLAAASCWGSCWGAGQADRLFLAFRPFCCWASIPFGSGILALPSLLRQRPD